jgi:hypothetical protein
MSEVTAAAATIGQDIDKEIAVLKARVTVVEAKVAADWAEAKAWVKSNWPHFVTWTGAALVVAKTDALSLVTKLL